MAIIFAPAVLDLLPSLELQLCVQPLSVDIICCWKNNSHYSVLVSEPLKTEVLIMSFCFVCVTVTENPSHGHIFTFLTNLKEFYVYNRK